ncbi:MAG: hypothetical protein SF029_10090 [bacterium]|nr:hypothetical protein [bacterium]
MNDRVMIALEGMCIIPLMILMVACYYLFVDRPVRRLVGWALGVRISRHHDDWHIAQHKPPFWKDALVSLIEITVRCVVVFIMAIIVITIADAIFRPS